MFRTEDYRFSLFSLFGYRVLFLPIFTFLTFFTFSTISILGYNFHYFCSPRIIDFNCSITTSATSPQNISHFPSLIGDSVK